MEVQLLKPWNGREAGYRFSPLSQGIAIELIKAGIAEEVKSKRQVKKSKAKKAS